MPLLGEGIIPSGAIGAQLTALTRRAFHLPLVVQIYQSSPLLAALLSNADKASGGVSSITVPVQGASMVQTQASDFSGTFNQPQLNQGVWNAEFNLKLMITPVPFLGMEGAVQMNEAVVPVLAARMNDAGNSITQYLSQKLWNQATDNGMDIIGLPGAIDNGTNLVTYGNINRTTYPWWQSYVASVTGTPMPTRDLMLQYIAATYKTGSEMPTFGVCGLGTWAALAQDFVGQERYMITPGRSFSDTSEGPSAAFSALMVAGIPIYADPNAAEGTFYFYNSAYGRFHIHEQAAFAFTGFESTLPNMQIGFVGAMVTILEHVITKPSAFGRVSGFGFLAI
jgi:hypothetical protein